ncbi:MAG: hypothetical protein ACYS76_06960, partial [Planctomycetota bacterium]
MHKLARQVRFSINPFLPDENVGYNSYASKPPGDGLAIFFELCVQLEGAVDPPTGFVVNVLDIDRQVREYVVPVFSSRLKADFRKGKHVGLPVIAELLRVAWSRLAAKFGA